MKKESCTIKVRYYSIYAVAAGRLEEDIIIEPNSNFDLSQLLTNLINKYGTALSDKIFDKDYNFKPIFWILVDGNRIPLPENLYELKRQPFIIGKKKYSEIIISSPLLVGG